MIAEVDAAMRLLLGTQTYVGEKIQVDLDPPSKDWAARRSGPVLNLFLNDVREDTTRRTANYLEIKNDEGAVIARRPQERTFMFTYALSGWTSRPEDDHALLGAALLTLLRYEYSPEEFCGGILAELASRGHPAQLKVGGLLFSERLATELWSAIGGEYRPTIAITVSVEIPAGLAEAAGPQQSEPPQFIFGNTETGTTTTKSGARADDPVDENGVVSRNRTAKAAADVAPEDAAVPDGRVRKRAAKSAKSEAD